MEPDHIGGRPLAVGPPYGVTDRPQLRLTSVTQQPTSPALTQDLVLECVDARGRTARLPAAFGYDPADPWAVQITFGRTAGSVRWIVGRDLLLRGITDPAGEGDVLLWPSIDGDGRATVVMELCSPDGRLVTQLRTHDLYRFLTRTLALVPAGAESIDLDAMVETLIGPSETK